MLNLPQLIHSSLFGLLLLSVTACSTFKSITQPASSAPSDCRCPSGASTPAPTPAPAVAVKPTPAEDAKPIAPAWAAATFKQMPAWENHGHASYVAAFAAQCGAADLNTAGGNNFLSRSKTTPKGLLDACTKARDFIQASQADRSNDNPKAKQFIEANFEVWQFQKEDGGKEGLLTGYFEPLLKGSRKKTGPYIAPLWGVPKDLITVELASLFPELEGKRVRGRVVGNKLVPYHDRQSWEGTASKKETPLVWIDNKLDAFLLQVQGSGRVQLPNGELMRLSYADQNGHPYKAIGRVLVQRGELTTEQATIPGITAWAEKNPNALDELLNANPSVVFFTENKALNPNDGPIGALGIPLTGELSLAVDRRRVPYGSMVWVDSTNPINGKPIQKGMLAQDTGGAITGRVRADFYWGTGKEAGQAAGLTRQPLKMWLIWPKGLALPDAQ